MPKSINDLKRLPGIGDYTASIIMAIVHKKPHIAFDGNVKRLTKRFFALNTIESSQSLKFLKNKSNIFLHKKRHGDLAQALIELGALVCKPKNPNCNICPIRTFCSFKKMKTFHEKKKIKKNKLKYIALCYLKNNKILVTNKNPSGFLNNMVTVPMVKFKTFKQISNKKNCEILKEKISHNISNSNLKIQIAILNKNLNFPNHFWLDKNNIKKYPIPVLTRKILKAINVGL